MSISGFVWESYVGVGHHDSWLLVCPCFTVWEAEANLSSWFLLLVQMLCSVLAGVYNEVSRFAVFLHRSASRVSSCHSAILKSDKARPCLRRCC